MTLGCSDQICILFYKLRSDLQTTAGGKLFNDELAEAVLNVGVDTLNMGQWLKWGRTDLLSRRAWKQVFQSVFFVNCHRIQGFSFLLISLSQAPSLQSFSNITLSGFPESKFLP